MVAPLLRFVRPTERLQRVLSWEGSLIDPVGGIPGAVVFSAVLAGARPGSTSSAIGSGAPAWNLRPGSYWRRPA